MPRKETEPLVRQHVHLFESDVERLRELYGENISVNRAIRMIIRVAVKRLNERIAETAEKPNLDQETLNEQLATVGSEAGEPDGDIPEGPAGAYPD